jgi:PRC-barrel domain
MGNSDQGYPNSELCYLSASKVASPAGVLSELDVLTPDGERLGTIEGVIIDAPARRICYFDIQSSGWLHRRHYLLEADAQIDPERKALRLLVNPERQTAELDRRKLPEFSDEHLLAALFASDAA